VTGQADVVGRCHQITVDETETTTTTPVSDEMTSC